MQASFYPHWSIRLMVLCSIIAMPTFGLFAQQLSILVREVSCIDLTLEKGSAPKAIIKAKGKVVTAGHTNPRLLQVLYVMPPADGIQDFDFYVDPPPPSTVVAQVIADIETPPLRLEHIPPWMKGVRVRAQTNSLDRSF